MTTTWLAYLPSPPRGVWHLGPLPIRAYALFIIAGIIVALIIGDRRFVARGGERGVVYDIALWMVPFGLIGGRLYHLATDWQTYFGQGGAGIDAALRIWDGGLGIWGAVALGAVGAWIGCRRRRIPLPSFMDAVAPGVVLAQAIGRLGNYFNQELYGRETTLPWGLEVFYRRDPAGFIDVHSLDGVSTGRLAAVVQPTFLYELIWNIMVFAALIYLDRRFTIGHGRLFGLYVALYCVGRFGVELLRDDTATHIAGIRINLFTSTFVFIGAVVYVMLAPKGREDPATVRGKGADAEDTVEPEPAAERAAVAAGSSVASSAITAVAPVTHADGEPVESAETVTALDAADPEAATAQVAETESEQAEAQQAQQPQIAEAAPFQTATQEPRAGEPEPSSDSAASPSREADGAEPQLAAADAAEPEVHQAEIEAADEPEPAPDVDTAATEVAMTDSEHAVSPGSEVEPAAADAAAAEEAEKQDGAADSPGAPRPGWWARLRNRRQRSRN
ncbi:prolipoprotein diacylglyceryl transferase [Mycobacterium simiae]|uniref:Phosphatidylglycerol--prolipoprotein diacylglyceryl transferase n=1 Tax=Mycobacterium simiae TaxID=1784 RepID=A0A5B1BIH5_MYCSI|nr:prolipoprotein diacylglyceryl transferase [Mycobacterium simiae]KAA1247243.1 prolipoprotein diacylglyceryl transferase [Mycobacterium simiae]